MKLLERLGRKKEPTRGPQVREWGGTPPHEAEQTPLPEPKEQRLAEPGVRDLSKRDYLAIFVRAAKEAKADQIPDYAAAAAYYTFLAIPSALLIAVGVFSLVASPDAVTRMMARLEGVVPSEAITLLEDSLTRVVERQSGGLTVIVIGALVALWTVSGAANAFMRALNVAYDREETRGFVKQRLTAIGMLACMLLAFGLVFGLLVLGPVLSDWIGGLLGLETIFKWLWWTLQWPILVLGLLLAFAGLLYLGPNVDHPRWQFLTFGSAFAVVLWLAASAGFALYVSFFGSYNKTWGSLAAVIIMLTWLWLSALAILFGAEINAEAERSRELRRGEPAAKEIQAPAKA